MKYLYKYRYPLLIISYFLLRLIIINVNSAEIGDSYNLLAATRSILKGFYPAEEKRLPLLPLMLIPGFWMNISLFWGRLLSIALSCLTLSMILKCGQLLKFKFQENVFLFTLIAFNPIFFYWSGRIMTDVLFLTLLSIILFILLKPSTIKNLFILGILGGLLIITRFEGWLVLFVLITTLYLRSKKFWEPIFIMSVGFLISLPWWLFNLYRFGNPILTSYTKEASQYIPGLIPLSSFLLYLLFLLGPLTLTVVLEGVKNAFEKNRKQVLPFMLIILIFLPLIAYWTAAVPRLFYTIIPSMAVLFVLGLKTVKIETHKSSWWLSFIVWVLGVVYLPSEFLRGSLGGFLILVSISMIFLISISAPLVLFKPLQKNWLNLFIVCVLLSNLVVSISVLYRAKDRGATVIRILSNIKSDGLVGYADETGISSYYLGNKGIYWFKSTGVPETLKWIRDNHVKYLLVTNEHVEEGAHFNVVDEIGMQKYFVKTNQFERTEKIDPFNRLFNKILGRKDPVMELKYSQIYEVKEHLPVY